MNTTRRPLCVRKKLFGFTFESEHYDFLIFTKTKTSYGIAEITGNSRLRVLGIHHSTNFFEDLAFDDFESVYTRLRIEQHARNFEEAR